MSTKKNIIFKLLLWFLVIIFMELSFSLLISKNISVQWSINVGLTALVLSFFFTIITSIGKEKLNTILSSVILGVFAVLFSTQAVFYKIFKVFFSFYDLGLQDQVAPFLKETVILVTRYSYFILLFFLPFILYLVFRKKIPRMQFSLKVLGILLICLIGSVASRMCMIYADKDKHFSTYHLIHNINNHSLSVKRLGVLNSYYYELRGMVFGFKPKEIKSVKVEEVEETTYEENKFEFSLKDNGNDTVNQIYNYMNEEQATLQNEYTGIFKDYNLVYITAESFSELGVREDLTPTLYKLIHSGFVFDSFYTPNNLSTIGGEFQSLTGLYPDYSTLHIWREGRNAYPFGLATTFQSLGYNTYAYHNNSFNFQDRDSYLASQGFRNYIGCWNGMEQRMNCLSWPESDIEMIDSTLGDYINSEQPFLAYYMTVSGHFMYTYTGNSIAVKNREFVENLPLSEGAQAYIATQIELDRALEHLINALKDAGKLEKTVFVLMADHYPYELDRGAINELSTYERNDIEINHNALIIWNSELETKEVKKPCMSTDVIPTVYNLFGIKYDSRMFTGKDILSTSFGIAILNDSSWISEAGVYNAAENMFYPNREVDEEYVSKVNQLVHSRLTISRLILESDYYRYLNW